MSSGPRQNPLFTGSPSRWVSALIFVVAVSFMSWLRLHVFPQTFIALTYVMPLLICLLHRDKLLLWTMTAVFTGMATFKTFWVFDYVTPPDLWQWLMQVANILVTAGVVNVFIDATRALRLKNQELEQVNSEVAAREEEISRQNEELQAQSEEMTHQNEELEHQAEELQAQSEELQNLNTELSNRQQILETLLSSVRDSGEDHIIENTCHALATLLGPDIRAVAVVEKVGDEIVVQTWEGEQPPSITHWAYSDSLTAVVMEEGRTAFVDLQDRPDFALASVLGNQFRSILATPLRMKKGMVGAVKAFSVEPRQWTKEHFHIIEWVANQCGMALDISRLQTELQTLNQSLEKTVEQRTTELKETVEELEHFSYTITHDMRAPLRAIQGFAGLLHEAPGLALNPEAKSCVEHITRSIQRMDRLIIDALSYSKAVRQELAPSPLSPEELLRDIVHSYPALQSPRAQIDIQSGMPFVMANQAGLTQCFSNLLTNAVKFVAPGTLPVVKIRAEHRDGFVRIWFEDNGIGIPHASQKQLFKMFQRGSKNYEGTGIGLALVRKVATRMDGRVGVESEPGQGSRFWLELPAATSGRNGRPATDAHDSQNSISI